MRVLASNGVRVMARTSTRVLLAGLEDGSLRELDGIAPLGVAAVGDEWWAWTPDALHRLDATGDTLEVRPHAEPLPPGQPVTSPYWRHGAWWSGDRSCCFGAPRDGGAAEDGFVIPIDGRSQLVVRAGSAGLRRAGGLAWSQKLPGSGRVVGGSVLFEGRLAGLVVLGDRGDHRILALDLRQGRISCALRLTDLASWSFAAHRGQIVVDNGDRLLVLDLRFGSVVHEWPRPAAPRALATDPALRHVVVLGPEDELELLQGGGRIVSTQLVGADVHVDVDVDVDADVASDDAPASPPPAARSADVALPTGAPAALWPRPEDERTSHEESAALLDLHVTYVATLAARAIAAKWDSGELTRAEDNHLPFHAEVVGLLQGERGRAPAEVDEATQRCALARARLHDARARAGDRRTPLASLANEVGLSPLATEILIVVAAPILRGELARLYAILANDRQRALVDELAVCQILGGAASRADVTRELDRDSPLRRFGLVVASEDRPRPFHALTIDPLVMRRLRDLPLDTDIEPYLEPRVATRAYDELRVSRARLAELLAALHAADPRRPVRLVVRGRRSSGRRTVLAAIAGAAGRTLGVLDVSLAGAEPATRAAVLREGLRRAMLRGWVPAVQGLDDISTSDRAARDAVRRVIAEHPGPVTLRLAHDTSPPLAPGYLQLDLPVLTEHERHAAWREVAARHALVLADSDADALAARYRVGVGVIEDVCADVAGTAAETADGAAPRDPTPRIEALLEQHIEARFGEIAQRVTRLATWSDVILPADVKDSVLELIARVRHRRRVYEEWGFDRAITTARGVTALFSGSPGTGKTMVAGVIANELGLALYRIDLSRVVSKWIGETERNLAEAFDAAEDGRAILLFDEADSLFSKRTEVKSSTDRYANLEVNYLLQRLDSFEGFAILTTNFGGAIDPAFRRRMTLRLTFPFPDEDEREQLWRAHLPPQLPREGELDLRTLARRFTMSGGYVRNSVLRAAFLASEEGAPLSQQHLERAVALEFRELGKLAESGKLE